jgi:hypothetical protein
MLSIKWTWFYVLCSVTCVLCSLPAYAQDVVDLPRVAFQEPPMKVFNMNEQLELQFNSDIPARELRARVFWGSKEELKERARNIPHGACAYYPTFIVNFASSNGEVKFGWGFSPYWLKQVSQQAFDNQVYTIVLEKARVPKLDNFRLYAKDVDNYFDRGQQIVIVAPPELKSGAEKAVERVRAIQVASTSTAPPERGREGQDEASQRCILITTARVLPLDSPLASASSRDQLTVQPCLAVGEPLPLHLPFAALSGACSLR